MEIGRQGGESCFRKSTQVYGHTTLNVPNLIRKSTQIVGGVA
jgi:hypothetical protein